MCIPLWKTKSSTTSITIYKGAILSPKKSLSFLRQVKKLEQFFATQFWQHWKRGLCKSGGWGKLLEGNIQMGGKKGWN